MRELYKCHQYLQVTMNWARPGQGRLPAQLWWWREDLPQGPSRPATLRVHHRATITHWVTLLRPHSSLGPGSLQRHHVPFAPSDDVKLDGAPELDICEWWAARWRARSNTKHRAQRKLLVRAVTPGTPLKENQNDHVTNNLLISLGSC